MENNQRRLFRILDKFFKRDDSLTILDIGARDCRESINFSQYYRNSKIYAFECNPETIPVCKKNIEGHQNITLVEKAISDSNGTITFYPINTEKTRTSHKDGNPGASSLLKASDKFKKEIYIQDEIKVESITLETFLKNNEIDAIDIMWVDVQGAEMLVLKGLKERVKDIRILHIELEFAEMYRNQALFKDVRTYLKDRGLSLIAFTNFSRYCCDAVFANNSLNDGQTYWQDGLILPFYKYIGIYFVYFGYIVEYIRGLTGLKRE